MPRKKRATMRSTPNRRPAPSSGDDRESNGAVRDGVLRIDVEGGRYHGQTIVIDPLLVLLAAEPLERSHRLEQDGDTLRATPAFIVDLDKAMQDLGYSSTPAIALHAWIHSRAYFHEAQKKTS